MYILECIYILVKKYYKLLIIYILVSNNKIRLVIYK